MSDNGNGSMNGSNGRPHALLRAGFPFYTTLGMRRVTTYPMDVVIGDEDRLYVLNRTDGQGGQVRRINWEDDDLDIFGSNFVWPVQMIRDDEENCYISDEGNHTITVWRPSDGELLDTWGTHGSEPGQLDRPSGIEWDNDGDMASTSAVSVSSEPMMVNSTTHGAWVSIRTTARSMCQTGATTGYRSSTLMAITFGPWDRVEKTSASSIVRLV